MREISEGEVRAALTFLQGLDEDFPDFAIIEDPSPGLLAAIDTRNMRTMRACLEAAANAGPVIEEAFQPGDEKHLRGWAKGNLQHHLIFDHGAMPSDCGYDVDLDRIHRGYHHPEVIPEAYAPGDEELIFPLITDAQFVNNGTPVPVTRDARDASREANPAPHRVTRTSRDA